MARKKIFAESESSKDAANKDLSLLEISKQLLRIHEDDIESGLSTGIYEEDENIETRAFIRMAHRVIDAADRQANGNE